MPLPQLRERRARTRFPVSSELTYKARALPRGSFRTGQGRSLDIASGGISFTVDDRLNEGEQVELSISWPALLDGKLALRLRVQGKVLRTDSRVAVCSIERYEFRTGGAAGGKGPVPAETMQPGPAEQNAFAARA